MTVGKERWVDIPIERVKELREKSGAGVIDCKRALEEARGDLERALALLRDRGLAQVAGRAGRAAGQGLVEAYVHGGGRIGVLVEVNCETDFVARTPEFRSLAHDIAMQIAWADPHAVDGEGAEPGTGASGELPLLQQPFIRDESRTVADLVREVAAKTGENIVVRRFTRYELGTI